MNKSRQINNNYLLEKDKIRKEISKKTLKQIDKLHIFNNEIYITMGDITIVHEQNKKHMFVCTYVIEKNELKFIPNTKSLYKITFFQDYCQDDFLKLSHLYQQYRKNLNKALVKQKHTK